MRRIQCLKAGILSRMFALIGLLVTVPVLIIPFYPEEAAYASSFLLAGAVLLLLSLVAALCGHADEAPLGWRETVQRSSVTVLSAWGAGILAGALPFLFSGKLGFVQALFESVSGWTTTGLSVLDVSQAPKIFLFHRGFMQYCGGLGFILMMLLFVQGKQAMNLYSAEGHPDKLMPSLGKTAWTIFLMYLLFLVCGVVAYVLCGMPVFDSIIHAMCALSTGGFSTDADSIGAYGSVPVEAVTIALMLIGTTNFAVLLLLLRGKLRRAARVSEVRFMLVLLVVTVPPVALSLLSGLYMSLGESLRTSLFNVVSALSTSGFSTMSYSDWPPFAVGVMIVLMLVGGGIGSTAGGLKMTRVYLLSRIVGQNLRQRLTPARCVHVPQYTRAQGRMPIDAPVVGDTVGFVGCYLLVYVIGSLLLTATANCSLTEAMFEFASSLGTVGLSIGITHPGTNAATLLIEIAGMLLGRLEIFIVLIGVYSGFVSLRRCVARLCKRRR